MRSIFDEAQVSLARFTFGLGVVGALATAAIALARAGGPALDVVAAILFTLPLCSLGEWLVHGVLYHGKVPGFAYIRRIHHAGHHFALFPPERYVQDGRFEFMNVRAPLMPFRMSDNALDNFLSSWGQIALHFVVGIPLIVVPAQLLVGDPWFTAAVLATLAFVSWLLAYVHGVIHTPRDRWIEHTRAFQWLDRHHYVHHIDLSANMNFMLPLCDVLFGTEKGIVAPASAAKPTFEEAKPMAKDIPPRDAAKVAAA
ncbi:hypothetical protein L6R52_26760 [Myxococcota bacterium]|nr:hypothetical protein [Myxococcota bacterium]